MYLPVKKTTVLFSFFTLHVSFAQGQTCDNYIVPSIPGGFTTRQFIDFSGVSPGGDVTSVLSSNGISISDYTVTSGPVPHTFTPKNLAFGSGSLNMKVSAYSGSGAIFSSQVVTNDVFKYASVRTVLKSSPTGGVVEGNFFYFNDSQEIDWEILTSTTLQASAKVPAGIWATNQPSTQATVPFTFDPTQDYHEYRIDWVADATTFYIDGVQKARLTTNVPTLSGPWMWNAWSNGDSAWSNGPPTADSITHISSIDIYRGYTSTPSGNLCNI